MPISKADLDSFYALSKMTEDMHELITRMRARLESTTGVYSALPSGSSGANDKIGNGVARYDALIQKFSHTLDEYAIAAADINEAVMSIEDHNLRNVMIYRYLMGMEWDEVAKKMVYSVERCYQFHRMALEQMGVEFLQ